MEKQLNISKTIECTDQPSFEEWCGEFKVSSNYHRERDKHFNIPDTKQYFEFIKRKEFTSN